MIIRRAARAIAAALPLSAALSLAVFGQGVGWQANPAVVAEASRQRPETNYVEARVPPYVLPDPLVANGSSITSSTGWPRRREEILNLFREHVYGRSPGKPERLEFERLEENPSALGGAATLRRVSVVSRQSGRDHRFEITLFLPNARPGPVPVWLLINNRPGRTRPIEREEPGFWPAERVIARGYGIAALQNADLAPDDKDRYRDGVIGLFEGSTTSPRSPAAWAAIAAWAWGARRAMDYFETDPRVDATRVAVVGHSRGGKAALWAGAEDERFALVVSNESGEGGAALSRRQFGETVERITTTFPHWFTANYSGFARREDALPIDQHMLLSLVAPRLLYVASADEDLWSDPRGEFLSLAEASPVYGLFGDRAIRPSEMPPLDRPLVVDRRAYHVRTGGHNLTPYDWDRFLDFADAGWRQPAWRDTYQHRLAALALIQTLNASILGSRSATLSLEQWCRDHGLAADATIVARPVPSVGQAPTAEQRKRLEVSATEDVKYRRVQLVCGTRVLSEAENWYVPGRLTPEMNRVLETTGTPFGRVIQPLDPYRVTFAVDLLWSPLPAGWERHSDVRQAETAGELAIPGALFAHRAVLYTREHRPFSEVREIYQRDVLAFPPPPSR
jgi:hypothetical protein